MKLQTILAFSIGPIAAAAFGLITIPIVAWVFSPEDVGRLNILQVTLSFCLLLSTLGMDQAYVREYHETTEQDALLKATFIPGFIFLLVCSIIAIPFGNIIAYQIFGEDNYIYFWITLSCLFISFIARFMSLILRMQEQGIAFSLSQIIPKALLLLIICIVIIFGIDRNFTTLSQALLISITGSIIVYIPFTIKQFKSAYSKNFCKIQSLKYFKYSFPLVISSMAYWGLVASSTIVMRYISTFSEIGIYAITTSVAGVAAIFQTIFTVVWAPIVYKWIADGVEPTRIDKVARNALGLVCCIFCLCGMFSWIIDFVLPTHYSSVKLLVLCAIVQPLLYTLSEITSVGIGISRRTNLTIWVTFISLIVNVILSIWLIPLHGAGGALVSNAVAFLVFFVARTEASALAWRQFPRIKMYLILSIVVLMSIITVFSNKELIIKTSLIWGLMLLCFIYLFKKEINEMHDLIKNNIKYK